MSPAAGSAPFAIIGAGPSGLATARAFGLAGIPFTVYERHEGVGGIWDIDNPGTPIYDSTHFISSRTLSNLDGLAFDEQLPDYPRHDQLLDYLRAFARANGVVEHLRTGVEVAALRRLGPGDWEVELATGEVARHRGVVMASGTQWTPTIPTYPGERTGTTLHSREYRSSEVFRGQRVLVVGAGNSGCDIACDAATVASHAAISTRRGYWVVPKHIFGQPADVFAHTGPNLPARAQQRVFEALLRLLNGDLTRHGWPAPDHHVLETHPILNSALPVHLSHGDLEHRSDIARLDGDQVHFVDGRVETYDVVVWATGYRLSFPYLEGVLEWPADNDPGLFLNVFHREFDDLFALGLIETDAGAWPHISLQAALIAQVVAEVDPAQATAFRRLKQRTPDLEGGVRHVDSPRHAYYTSDVAYRAYARRLLGVLQSGRLASTEPIRSSSHRAG